MIKEGILGKFGKPTEQTPKNWREMLYDVSAAPPVSKVNFTRNKTSFLYHFMRIFQRTLEQSSTMEESQSEKKKKDKKIKVEDDDDNNQMQTSSVADDSVSTSILRDNNLF